MKYSSILTTLTVLHCLRRVSNQNPDWTRFSSKKINIAYGLGRLFLVESWQVFIRVISNDLK